MPGPRAAKLGGMANPTCHRKVSRPRRSGEQVSNALQGSQKCLPFNGAPPFLGLYLKGSNVHGKLGRGISFSIIYNKEKVGHNNFCLCEVKGLWSKSWRTPVPCPTPRQSNTAHRDSGMCRQPGLSVLSLAFILRKTGAARSAQ